MAVKVAVIEDDVPTSNQLKGWIESARPGIEVVQWFNRDDAEAASAEREVAGQVAVVAARGAAAEAAAGGGTVPGGAPGDAARAVPNGAQGGA